MSDPPAPRPISRRDFFANALLGVAGALGLAMLGERFLAFLYPVVPPEREIEVPIGPRSAVPPGRGTVVHSPVGHIALEEVNGELRGFSAVCTHLGCIIQWQPGPGHVWFCPCHRGTYDRDGHVTSGPPPRSLEPVPLVVRDGQVFARLKARVPAPSREPGA
jgi:cytochrome b6-f complex iron-sulfur subunit